MRRARDADVEVLPTPPLPVTKISFGGVSEVDRDVAKREGEGEVVVDAVVSVVDEYRRRTEARCAAEERTDARAAGEKGYFRTEFICILVILL